MSQRGRTRRCRRAVAAAALATAALACWQPPQDAVAAGPPVAGGVSIVTGSGAWSWFADPRAVYHAGRHRRTYAGWVSRRGNIVVASIDHSSGRVRRAVVARRLGVDDHNNPALVVRPDGRVAAYYSMHNGGALFVRRTRRPEDVSAWGPVIRLPRNTPGGRGFTYPNVVRLERERRTYVLWRGGDWNPAFTRRRDGGRWARARRLVAAPGRRPYVKVAGDGAGVIHLAFSGGHPREGDAGIWYLRYERGALWHADGRRVARLADVPVPYRRADPVHRAGGRRHSAWIHDVAADARGRPVIVYAVLVSPTDHRYRYARWTGRRWAVHELARAGGTIDARRRELHYSGGAALDPADPATVYVSVERSGVHEIERRHTADGGRTWTVQRVTSGSDVDQVRPVVPRGRPAYGGADVLWLRGAYRGWRDYATEVMAWAQWPPASAGITGPRR